MTCIYNHMQDVEKSTFHLYILRFILIYTKAKYDSYEIYNRFSIKPNVFQFMLL